MDRCNKDNSDKTIITVLGRDGFQTLLAVEKTPTVAVQEFEVLAIERVIRDLSALNVDFTFSFTIPNSCIEKFRYHLGFYPGISFDDNQ